MGPSKLPDGAPLDKLDARDRKSTRLNSSHQIISYAVFCLEKKRMVDVGVPLPAGPVVGPPGELERPGQERRPAEAVGRGLGAGGHRPATFDRRRRGSAYQTPAKARSTAVVVTRVDAAPKRRLVMRRIAPVIFFLSIPRPPTSTLFPYTTLFR